jgi:hypothetical protein
MSNVTVEDKRATGPHHLSAALEGPLAMIRQWLDKITAGIIRRRQEKGEIPQGEASSARVWAPEGAGLSEVKGRERL